MIVVDLDAVFEAAFHLAKVAASEGLGVKCWRRVDLEGA